MPTWKIVESVTAGHPDKICDQIADAILDEFLRRDPATRAHIEVFGSHGMLAVGGSVRSKADFDCAAVATATYRAITGHDGIEPFVNLGRPAFVDEGTSSPHAMTVVHGYATKETREFLPFAYVVSQMLVRRLDDMRATPAFSWIGPHAKVQVVCEGHRVLEVTILVSHPKEVVAHEAQASLAQHVVEPMIGSLEGVRVRVNPAGVFDGGELLSGTGLTGRKSACDTYGGLIPPGASCLSGKDPYAPDRSGTYAARQIAKTLVAAGHGSAVFVRLGYVPGYAEPTFVSATSSEGKDLTSLVRPLVDLRPNAIVERLNLARPIFQATARYGHFTNRDSSWESVLHVS